MVSLSFLATALAVALADPSSRPTITAAAASDSLHIDGKLDEPDWAAAIPIDHLTMVEPDAGAEPQARTEVRVLANSSGIVIGIRCFDPEPAKIVTFTRERDGSFDGEDHVIVVLDPFQDGQSGYVFSMNPGGARLDALINAGGESTNDGWDSIWEGAASRDELGWSAEIRIPALSINFARGLSAWGFNVERRIERTQELHRWASPTRDAKLYQMSRSGLLTGLPEFALGRGLAIRPALVTGFERFSRGVSTRGTGDVSLDVTQRLSPNLSAVLTVNTDFAETEVDTRQTNLTRFPLFFPEKRSFFLEGSDTFDFGLGLARDIRPFFSRRIGLVAGNEVPLLAGMKVAGREGRTSIGGLIVRTRSHESLTPATTLGAMRIKRNVLAESNVGILATAGDPRGRSGASTLGADATFQTSRFRGNQNAWFGVWGLMARRDGLTGNRGAFGAKLDLPNDLWDISATFRRVGDAFDPSLGFVPRPGIYSYRLGVTYAPRLKGTFIRQMFHEFISEYITNLAGERESYRIFTAPINWRLESGDRFEANVVPTGERLTEPFEVADDVVVPPGSYNWRRYRLEVETASKRKLAGQATWWFGGFYGGRLNEVSVEGTWTPSPVVSFLFSVDRNSGHLSFGDFAQTVGGVTVRLNLSPDLQANTFVQYDDESRSIGTNTRLRWTFRPQGDLFVIYNHNVREFSERPRRWETDSNALLIKAQYTWRK